MRALYDVNVLAALLDPQHTQHAKAKAWHEGIGQIGWATCPITQNGMFRIVSQPRYTNPATVAELARVAKQSHGGRITPVLAGQHFACDCGSARPKTRADIKRTTNVYLLALAVKHAACRVTLDTRISRTAVLNASLEHLVVCSDLA